jgi:hypothetical protein
MRFSADFNLLKQDDLKWFIRAGFVVGQIERRKEKLAGGIVLSIPSLSEGPIPDRVAVNASMRACVVFADVSGFETGALWAVTLLRRAHRSARHSGKPCRIDAPRLPHRTPNKLLPEHLAAVERALWPADGVAALRAMPAGILHPGHHPLADHVPDLATGGPRRKVEGHAANVFAWR